ncbi:MAG: PAS domain-containing protein [Planctomycetes bacterium]|nr:PAS domain-containing protein [Planctomycetota bacterium]
MPRTRLVWQFFAALAAVLAGLFVAGAWLASVSLGRLADAAAFRRLEDAAALAIATLDAGGASTPHRIWSGSDGMVVEFVAADTPAGAAAAGSTMAGPPRRTTRFDTASRQRVLSVTRAVESGPASGGQVRVTLQAGSDDKRLARDQRTLLGWQVVWGLAAAALGYLAISRLTRPVEELARTATSLADGTEGVTLKRPESRELASLSAAIAALHGQLIERGLTIGRQGTQQEAVLGSMIEGVLAIDSRQRIVSINATAAELLGLDAAGAVGRPLQDAVDNADLRRFALLAIDCRAPVEDDLLLRGPRDRTLRVRGTALRDVYGEGGAVIVLNDITDIQRLENVRREFVANVSHELKTPVASIKGFVETLLDGAADDPDDSRRFLRIIARQADRLGAIIEDLLSLSRIEQQEGAGSLPVERVALATVVDNVVADCLPRARDRAIELAGECPPDLDAAVNAPLLEQALINLVDNAIKYSDSGRRIWITVAPGSGAGAVTHVRLAVRDEGCGIEAEHLPRLFERFYRIDKGRSRKLGGTGLGLSIVKHIALAHGGTVAVESTPGVGSTFTLVLPRDGATT